ncbi:hypothetical protein VU08_01060 [Desulfobulbus sp. F5]|nr:hypothetical protein [Desulfobulbus sp. F5]
MQHVQEWHHQAQGATIRERLGASLCTDESIWEKPKGMHWKTFERLKNKADEASEQSWLTAARLFGTLDPFA